MSAASRQKRTLITRPKMDARLVTPALRRKRTLSFSAPDPCGGKNSLQLVNSSSGLTLSIAVTLSRLLPEVDLEADRHDDHRHERIKGMDAVEDDRIALVDDRPDNRHGLKTQPEHERYL